MTESCPPAYIEFANALADASGPILRQHFRTAFDVESKSDASPVTIADRAAEAAMRALIAERFPEHGIIGEEYGDERADAPETWVLDPIDGTKSFITGRPIFGTLIALLREERPILGIIDQPILGERWVGARGMETQFGGASAKVRACPSLSDASLGTTAHDLFDGEQRIAFERLAGRARHTVYGGDCYAYALLSSGHLDLVVEAGLQTYDYCALVPVIEGAGGIITDWRGRPLEANSDGSVVAAGDPRVHRAALEVLGGLTT